MNTNPESKPRYEIMNRVRTVRGVRGTFSSPITSTLFGIALASCMTFLVSVGDIISNTMTYVKWSERFSYAFSSFIHSRFIVQTLAGLIACVSLIAFIKFLKIIPVRKIRISIGSTQ